MAEVGSIVTGYKWYFFFKLHIMFRITDLLQLMLLKAKEKKLCCCVLIIKISKIMFQRKIIVDYLDRIMKCSILHVRKSKCMLERRKYVLVKFSPLQTVCVKKNKKRTLIAGLRNRGRQESPCG